MSGQGALIYKNLLAANRCDPRLRSSEVQLLTDSSIVGEYDMFPYQFLNAGPFTQDNEVKPAIVLRTAFYSHKDFPLPDERKTDSSGYHEGSLEDEAAALASLILGARIQCGATTREFRSEYPAEGRPCYHDWRKTVTLSSRSNPILPPNSNGVYLGNLTRLQTLRDLLPTQSIALVKAARLFQQAMWLAESDTTRAWLLMVSSIETASKCWKKALSALDRMRVQQSELFEYVSSFNNQELLERVAKSHENGGIKAKFLKFLTTFCPSAPSNRPPPAFQVDWSEANLRLAFSKIYTYRSKSLHEGTGFPLPMTQEGLGMNSGWKAIQERPSALTAPTLGATWNSSDCPMLLHIFEYIVRHSLLSWWSSEVNVNQQLKA